MTINNNGLISEFLRLIEESTKAETEKIIQKYQEEMTAQLEEARARIVAQAGVRMSEIMSIHDLGTTIRIEIVKRDSNHDQQ